MLARRLPASCRRSLWRKRSRRRRSTRPGARGWRALGDRPLPQPASQRRATRPWSEVDRSSRPGEVSLAHNGVLFLDELPEFRRNVLEALRQPLEERSVTIARSRGRCGCRRASSSRRHESMPLWAPWTRRLRLYAQGRTRLSGADLRSLLDRVDIQVEVAPVTYEEMMGPPGECSAAVAVRVAERAAVRNDRLDRTGRDPQRRPLAADPAPGRSGGCRRGRSSCATPWNASVFPPAGTIVSFE